MNNSKMYTAPWCFSSWLDKNSGKDRKSQVKNQTLIRVLVSQNLLASGGQFKYDTA